MKRASLLPIVILMLFVIGCVTTPLPEDRIKIQRIIETDGSKDELYRLTNEWMAKNFRSSSNVIQYQDKAEGIIVGRGFKETTLLGFKPTDAWFTMTIEMKENRSRVSIEDVYGEVYSNGDKMTIYFESYPKDEEKLVQWLNAFVDDYTDYINAGIEEW